MLGNLAIGDAPQIIVAGGGAAVGALADGQDKVALGKHHVGAVVNHFDALLGQGCKRVRQAAKTISDSGVMLDVRVAVEVVRSLLGLVALHDVEEEVAHKLAVLRGAARLGDLKRAVDLRVARGVRLDDGSQVVPMLGDEAGLVEAEDVEGHLLACAGEVVHGLQEHVVAVGEGADGIHSRGGVGGSQVLYRAYEGIATRAVGQVVLDVALIEKGGGQIGVAACERADKGKRVGNVALLGGLGLRGLVGAGGLHCEISGDGACAREGGTAGEFAASETGVNRAGHDWSPSF